MSGDQSRQLIGRQAVGLTGIGGKQNLLLVGNEDRIVLPRAQQLCGDVIGVKQDQEGSIALATAGNGDQKRQYVLPAADDSGAAIGSWKNLKVIVRRLLQHLMQRCLGQRAQPPDVLAEAAHRDGAIIAEHPIRTYNMIEHRSDVHLCRTELRDHVLRVYDRHGIVLSQRIGTENEFSFYDG